MAASGTIGALIGAFAAGRVAMDSIPGSRASGSASRSSSHTLVAGLTAVGSVTAAIILDVGINLVSFTRPFIDVVAKGPGLGGLLLCLLAQPSGFNLRLLRIGPGSCCLRFTLARIKFPVFGVAADFRSLFAVRLVPLLLDRLTAPPAHQQQQHDQHHHNNGNYNPNPWSCFQITHHFPLDVTGQAQAFPTDSFGTVYNSFSKGTYLLLVIMLIILRPVLLVLDQIPAFLERESEDDREPMAPGPRLHGSAGLYRNSG